MGAFLSMSGVARSGAAAVEGCLRPYFRDHDGRLETATADSETGRNLWLSESASHHVTVLYPHRFQSFEQVTTYLSETLGTSVFFFHIDDEDLWMYLLYANGQELDRFNPVPAYWNDDISEDEKARWAGNASVLAAHWPGAREDMSQPYLVQWNRGADSDEARSIWQALKSRDPEAIKRVQPALAELRQKMQEKLRTKKVVKAFPDDRFGFEDCWQLIDFMRRLDLVYPIDDQGTIHGKAFSLELPQ